MSVAEKPLMPYAMDVAHGSGRTPIGIVLFAASHLLLGACCALWLVAVCRYAPVAQFRAVEWLIVGWVITLAASALVGGCALLLKGRAAWTIAVVAMAALAVGESIAAAFGSGMAVRFAASDRIGALIGLGVAVVMLILLGLCTIVLRYLGRPKAQVTFALPAGEVPAIVRWLPLCALIFAGICILTGLTLAEEDFWTRR